MSGIFCVMLVVFMVMNIAVTPSRAWFFRYIAHGGTRNCFCKVVDNNDYGHIIHDFGSITSCHGWPNCACSRPEIAQCISHCDKKVNQWVKSGCKSGWKGKKVIGQYKGSSCTGHRGATSYTYTCR